MLIIDDFFKKMIGFFPDISTDLHQRMKENFVGADTIVIEEVIMPKVLEILNKETDLETIKEIFNYFEEVCANSDEHLNNVFSITALEILGNDKNILKKAKKYMGPITTKLQRKADIAIGRQA